MEELRGECGKQPNAKVSGAGMASAGLPGCAAKTTENK